MPKIRKPSELPTKACVICGRHFTWRKAWAKVWDEVKYCSGKCRGKRGGRGLSQKAGVADKARQVLE